MRLKTIFIIIVTIILTVVIMQNNQEVKFNILFWQPYISNLIIMVVLVVTGFMLGVLVARPRKIRINTDHEAIDHETNSPHDTLSDEDRDYIN